MMAAKKRGRRPGPRIRSIKPETWQSEKVGRLSDRARLLFVGLVTLADDEGRFRALPSVLIGHVFPYDERVTAAAVKRCLGELATERIVVLYSEDGVPYGAFRNWRKHQRLDKPTPSELPPPPDAEIVANNAPPQREDDANDRGLIEDSSTNNSGEVVRPPRGGAHPGPGPDPGSDPSTTTTTENAKVRREREIAEVWDHYLDAFHPDRRGRLPDLAAHRQHIEAALRVRPVEVCKLAITGLARSPFHRGENGDGRRWTEIRYALHGNRRERESDAERIDRMAARATEDAAPRPTSAYDELMERAARLRAAENVIEGEVAA